MTLNPSMRTYRGMNYPIPSCSSPILSIFNWPLITSQSGLPKARSHPSLISNAVPLATTYFLVVVVNAVNPIKVVVLNTTLFNCARDSTRSRLRFLHLSRKYSTPCQAFVSRIRLPLFYYEEFRPRTLELLGIDVQRQQS